MTTKHKLLNSLKRLTKVLETKDNPSRQELGCMTQSGEISEVDGICSWVAHSKGTTGAEADVLVRLLEQWPEGTGCRDFPIPAELSTGGRFTPLVAFTRHSSYPFNPDQPYCQARRRLLDWLIEQLESESEL